jgi:PAS domain S-box-containing protein
MPDRKVNALPGLIVDLFEKAHVSIWACDANGHIVLWNPGAAALYKMTAEQVMGQPYWDLFVDDHEKYAAIEDNAKVIDHGKTFVNQLAFDRSDDGAQRQMLTNCFRIEDPETGEAFLAEVGVEISDLELRENEHRTLREVGVERRAMEQNGLRVRIDALNARIVEDIQEGREEFRTLRTQWRAFISREGASEAEREFGQARLHGLKEAWQEAQLFLKQVQRDNAACTSVDRVAELEELLDREDVLERIDAWGAGG